MDSEETVLRAIGFLFILLLIPGIVLLLNSLRTTFPRSSLASAWLSLSSIMLIAFWNISEGCPSPVTRTRSLEVEMVTRAEVRGAG